MPWTMIWLNLYFLFFITQISFAVDLQVDYGFYPIVFSIYALVLIFAGSMLAVIWFHAKKNELIENTLTAYAIQNITLQSILTPIVIAGSILISIINVQTAYYFWLTDKHAHSYSMFAVCPQEDSYLEQL
ncbi:MAG: hypothetical protein ACRD8W_09815 [Nitrososphaeraceae archaeon]